MAKQKRRAISVRADVYRRFQVYAMRRDRSLSSIVQDFMAYKADAEGIEDPGEQPKSDPVTPKQHAVASGIFTF